jgi:hypothetical protein
MWKAYTAVGRSYDLSTAVGRLASRAVGWDFHFDCCMLVDERVGVRKLQNKENTRTGRGLVIVRKSVLFSCSPPNATAFIRNPSTSTKSKVET